MPSSCITEASGATCILASHSIVSSYLHAAVRSESTVLPCCQCRRQSSSLGLRECPHKHSCLVSSAHSVDICIGMYACHLLQLTILIRGCKATQPEWGLHNEAPLAPKTECFRLFDITAIPNCDQEAPKLTFLSPPWRRPTELQ